MGSDAPLFQILVTAWDVEFCLAHPGPALVRLEPIHPGGHLPLLLELGPHVRLLHPLLVIVVIVLIVAIVAIIAITVLIAIIVIIVIIVINNNIL